MLNDCPNCGFTLTNDFIYCPRCSQKTQLHRLSLHEVLHDGLHYFTHADKGLFNLLKDLLLKTGRVAKEYVAGKRKKHFPPLNFFLIVAAVYVLMMSSVAPAQSNTLRNHPEINRIPDPVQRERVIKIYERQGKAISFLNKYSNVVSMIAAPLICFIYWLFYIRGRYNYTEHLVGCMYMSGFTNLVYILILVPLSLLLKFRNSNLLIGLLVIFQLTYNSVYYYYFIGKDTKSSALKATVVSLFAVMFWMGFSYYAVRMYIQNGFWGWLG